jgi:hypothetical protein
MAIFIFLKNTPDLYRIAENQDIMDQNKNFFDHEYDLVTVSQEDFHNVRLNKIFILNRTENTVTFEQENANIFFTKQLQLQEHINSIVSAINSYLDNNLNKPMASDIITYKNYLLTIKPSTLITEEDMSVDPPISAVRLNGSIEEYVENQGIKAINLLQLL